MTLIRLLKSCLQLFLDNYHACDKLKTLNLGIICQQKLICG